MSRYTKYFLQHLLCVEDTFSRYYVQDDSWGLDVSYFIFDWEEEAEDRLAQCIELVGWAEERSPTTTLIKSGYPLN